MRCSAVFFSICLIAMRCSAGWRIQKALNVDAKEEKTEISCMLCMQDQVDDIIASGADITTSPFRDMIAAAAVEQPPCADYLHTIAQFVKECGCNGDLLRELDAFTKARPSPTLLIRCGCSRIAGHRGHGAGHGLGVHRGGGTVGGEVKPVARAVHVHGADEGKSQQPRQHRRSLQPV